MTSTRSLKHAPRSCAFQSHALVFVQQVRDFCTVVTSEATSNGGAADSAGEAAELLNGASAATTSRAAAALDKPFRKVAEAACATLDPSTNLPTGDDFRTIAFLLMFKSASARELFGFGGLERNPETIANLLRNTDDTSAGGLPPVVWAKVKVEGTSPKSNSPEELVVTDPGGYDKWDAWQQARQGQGVRGRVALCLPRGSACSALAPCSECTCGGACVSVRLSASLMALCGKPR